MLEKCAACPPSCSSVTSAVLPEPTWLGVARLVKFVCSHRVGECPRGKLPQVKQLDPFSECALGANLAHVTPTTHGGGLSCGPGPNGAVHGKAAATDA